MPFWLLLTVVFLKLDMFLQVSLNKIVRLIKIIGQRTSIKQKELLLSCIGFLNAESRVNLKKKIVTVNEQDTQYPILSI